MKILVINGPNLNMLGIREKNIYGADTYESLLKKIQNYCDFEGIEVEFYQSNHEGCLVDRIQEAYFQDIDGIVINPGAYTHTSIAIADAVKAVGIPTVEVHISNVKEREPFRQVSYIGLVATASVIGEGLQGYLHAMDILIDNA